jgi:hypothetical protein
LVIDRLHVLHAGVGSGTTTACRPDDPQAKLDAAASAELKELL